MANEKTVLIFGVNGFVGPYLAREFASHGYKIVGSDRKATCALDEVERYYSADLLDGTAVKNIVTDSAADIIVNLAAISSVGQSWGNPQGTIEINVVGTLNILEAARLTNNNPKVLLVGSSEEYAASNKPLNEDSKRLATSPYGISKIAQDQFAELYGNQHGLQIYRTRSFNHTGVGQADTFVLPSFCKQAALIDSLGKPGTIKVGNLEVYRDFSDVRDIVRAYRFIVESDYDGEVFNVGSGQAFSLSQLLNTICSFSSVNIQTVIDPDRLRPVDNKRIVCDPGKLKRMLGWSPRFDIEMTLKNMFDWYRDRT